MWWLQAQLLKRHRRSGTHVSGDEARQRADLGEQPHLVHLGNNGVQHFTLEWTEHYRLRKGAELGTVSQLRGGPTLYLTG